MLDHVNACASLSAHVSKLSVLLSAEMGVAPAFTKSVSIFLIAIATTNGLLFENKINSTKVRKCKRVILIFLFTLYCMFCSFSCCCTVEYWG